MVWTRNNTASSLEAVRSLKNRNKNTVELRCWYQLQDEATERRVGSHLYHHNDKSVVSYRCIVCIYIYIYRNTGCPGGNVPGFGRMFLTLKYTDITQNTYIRSWTVTEIMARERCGLLAVPRTVPVSRIVTRTLRMSVLQSHSRIEHIPPSLSTDVTITVDCNSILLDILVPRKVFGTLRTTTTLVRVYVV